MRVFIALEHFFGFALHALDELFHIGFEHFPPTSTDSQRQRPIGIGKIVHVTPIFRHRRIGRGSRLPVGNFLEKGFDDTGFAGAGKSGDKNIETGLVHAQTEFDRADRAVLADKIFQRRHLRGTAVRQKRQIAAPGEFLCWNFEACGHDELLGVVIESRIGTRSALVNCLPLIRPSIIPIIRR